MHHQTNWRKRNWRKRMGLFVGLLSVLIIFIPIIKTFAQWRVRPGQHMQVISLVGTKAGGGKLNSLQHASALSRVAVVAGDHGVAKAQVDAAAMLIKSVSSHILSHSIGKLPTSQTEIFLYSSQPGYKAAVKKAFSPQDVTLAVQETGGFTLGSKIYIPLYKYHSQAFLANTLTHELTHATLNEMGIGGRIPTWMNEGLAWYNGTTAETTLDKTAAQQLTQHLDAQLKQAQRLGKLQAIHRDGSRVLEKNPPYNIEFQDYLGVRYLINTYGEGKVTRLISNLKHKNFKNAFSSLYPMSANAFTTSFTGGPVHNGL